MLFCFGGSVDLGEAYANHWLRESGGHADADTYHIILSEEIRMYRSAGTILFAIGIWFLRKEAMRFYTLAHRFSFYRRE
ncbi:hypothetical protein HT574_05330 [Parageobacillus sp. VR-IP]|uniref:hypothetical protein n=1 Tax=Parageobacillus sp. VR-IP TaxID=2742205 RepID=UPI00158304F7|nr:hypothetical protein [Parageobacillus sp. VR-IP]NUK29532.1 hypothetical protein [Parageobacillus sp. VR-IP]